MAKFFMDGKVYDADQADERLFGEVERA
jgi:hypothetical protein